MRESRSYGSVRGVAGDRYPYRDLRDRGGWLSLPANDRFRRKKNPAFSIQDEEKWIAGSYIIFMEIRAVIDKGFISFAAQKCLKMAKKGWRPRK